MTKMSLTSAAQPVQVNCCARLVQRTLDSQKGACCAAPMSPGISGGAHSPGKNKRIWITAGAEAGV